MYTHTYIHNIFNIKHIIYYVYYVYFLVYTKDMITYKSHKEFKGDSSNEVKKINLKTLIMFINFAMMKLYIIIL